MRAICELETLRTIVDAAWFLSSEATLHFKSDGLHLNVVDDANAGLVNICAPPEAFTVYEVAEDLSISLELGKLSEMLGTAKKGEPVTLEVNQTTKSLEIQSGKIKFSLRLLDNSIVRICPAVPDLEFTGLVNLESDDFVTAIRASSKVANHISFELDDESFRIVGTGDINHVRLSIPADSLSMKLPPEPIRALFATDYMEDIVKTVAKTDGITMDLGDSYPMQIGLVVNGVRIKYLVAPRIEHD